MSPPPASGGPPPEGSALKIYLLSAGVIASFAAFGYAQEAVYKTEFGPGKEHFTYSSFLVLLQSLGNALVAGLVLVAQAKGRRPTFSGGVPLRDWLIVALGYFGAHKMGLSALAYISFPLQVICKSCKAIPVMAGERVFAGKRHSAAKVCAVVCLCVGVVMFTLLGPKKKSAASDDGDGSSFDAKTATGLALVFGALVCDGVYGPYQNKIVAQHGTSPYHLMFNMNLYQGLISLGLCLYQGEVQAALSFVTTHGTPILRVLAIFSAAMALGNIFIYQLQHAAGALTVTTVTTMRKLISVLASVLAFGHTLSPAQWAATAVVVFNTQIGKLIAAPLATSESEKKKKKKA